VFDGELEIEPVASNPEAVIVSNTVPAAMPPPVLGHVGELSTNVLDPFAVASDCSLVTFTNVYLYSNTNGGAPGNFYSSSGYTTLYFTQGPFGPGNTNTMELFVPAYTPSSLTNLWGKPVPLHCTQLTGAWENYEGTGELEMLGRPQDFVTNAPPSFPVSFTQAKDVSNLSWPVQAGSTYSVNAATNLNGPWVNEAFGLGYYPTNGVFSETNSAAAKFYLISTP
jgi:hypothetical protein